MSFTSTGGPFGAIRPDEQDFFTFDFTARIGATGTIEQIEWSCAVSLLSPPTITDPDPQGHIIEVQPPPPTTPVTTTTALCGGFMDGATYTLTAKVTLDDQRVLVLNGDVEGQLTNPADATLTVDQFRDDFPAFADANRFPDEEVQYWIDQAVSPPNISPAIDPVRWGQFYDLGLRLWVAHNLAVEDMMVQRAGPPGEGSGPGGRYGYSPLVGSGVAASKSVNGVSISYDNAFGQTENAGWWGLTPWGNQYLYYLRLAGSAPIHLIGAPG